MQSKEGQQISAMGTLFALTNDCSPVGRSVLLLYGKQIDEVNLRSWPEAELAFQSPMRSNSSGVSIRFRGVYHQVVEVIAILACNDLDLTDVKTCRHNLSHYGIRIANVTC